MVNWKAERVFVGVRVGPVGVMVGVWLGVSVIVGVEVAVGRSVLVGVSTGVSLGSGVSVMVGVGVCVHSGGSVGTPEVLLGVTEGGGGGSVKTAMTTGVGGWNWAGIRPGKANTAATQAIVRQLNAKKSTARRLNMFPDRAPTDASSISQLRRHELFDGGFG